MALPDFYKPVGGVVAAELFPVGGLASPQEMVAGRGVAVSLMDDGSSYEEELTARDGQVSVLHTLALCSDRKLAAEWFDRDSLRRRRCRSRGRDGHGREDRGGVVPALRIRAGVAAAIAAVPLGRAAQRLAAGEARPRLPRRKLGFRVKSCGRTA